MSTTRPLQQPDQHRETDETWECDFCEADHAAHDFFNDAMCSEECERRDRAETLLNKLRHDHRFCFSCGRRLKTVERPPEDVTLVVGPCRHDAVPNVAKDVLVGYEYATEHADHGEISLDVVDDPRRGHIHPEAEDRLLADRVGNGVTCSCGATDHRDADPTLRSRWAIEVAHNLQEATAELRAEGKTDERLRRDAHFDALIEGASHEDALAQALVL